MKKKTNKKSKKTIKRDVCTYGIEILDWEMSYSFSVNQLKA